MLVQSLTKVIKTTALLPALCLVGGWALPAIAEAQGSVEPVADEQPKGAAPSERLLAVPQGEEMNIERDVSLFVWEDAVVKPGFTGALMVGRDGGRIRVQSVKVNRGRVDAVFSPAEKERGVLFAGPDSISAISSGGRLAFSVTDKRVYVEVLEGEALAGSQGRFKKLQPGIVRVFQRSTGRSSDEKRADAPRFAATRGLGVAMTGSAIMGVRGLGAGTYCVSLLDAQRQPVGAPHCGPGEEEIELEVPRAGMFFAVGRRLGEHAMGSELSEPVKLQVLGLASGQKPPVDGVFLLDRWERVQLKGTEGLELRYGVSKVFVPAGESLGLPMGRGTTVELRHPSTPDQRTRLRLAPKYGKVETNIGPANPHWPGRPLEIAVKARDGAGKLLPPGENLKVAVSVNSEPYEAKWTFSKRGLKAKVLPQRGLGPWVVRVSVFDDKGKMIGRDVIDVLPRSKGSE